MFYRHSPLFDNFVDSLSVSGPEGDPMAPMGRLDARLRDRRGESTSASNSRRAVVSTTFGSLYDEPLDQSQADARRAAGDHGNLAIQPSHRCHGIPLQEPDAQTVDKFVRTARMSVEHKHDLDARQRISNVSARTTEETDMHVEQRSKDVERRNDW